MYSISFFITVCYFCGFKEGDRQGQGQSYDVGQGTTQGVTHLFGTVHMNGVTVRSVKYSTLVDTLSLVSPWSDLCSEKSAT